MLLLVAAMGAAGAGGCAGTGEPETGVLSVNLVGRSPSGTVYRLRDATITVTGPGSDHVFNTEDAPDRPSLSADVVTGDYEARLEPGFRVERIRGTSATTIPAELTSPNPSAFAVFPRQRTTVPLRFRVDNEHVDMTQGYDIVLEVDEVTRDRELIVTSFDGGTSGGAGGTPLVVFPPNADGEVAPRREIEGEANLLARPRGITVFGDEIFVVDQDALAVSVFPRNATGDVAPLRRISGPSTQLDNPTSVLVSGDELYVAQKNSTIAVFPLGASGDAVPTRTITDVGTSGYLAIANGHLYASDFAGLIRVFPADTVGPAMPPHVIGLSGATTGIAISNGELFAIDIDHNWIHVFERLSEGAPVSSRLIMLTPALGFVDQIAVAHGELYVPSFFDNVIYVFPADANGPTDPIRTIRTAHGALNHPIGVFVQ